MHGGSNSFLLQNRSPSHQHVFENLLWNQLVQKKRQKICGDAKSICEIKDALDIEPTMKFKHDATPVQNQRHQIRDGDVMFGSTITASGPNNEEDGRSIEASPVIVQRKAGRLPSQTHD